MLRSDDVMIFDRWSRFLYTALDFYVDSIGARIACLYRDGMRGMINTNTVAFVDFNFYFFWLLTRFMQ